MGRTNKAMATLRNLSDLGVHGLMDFASERLAEGMSVCLCFSLEAPPRPWTEQVLPYGLAEMMLITPSRWSLTEASRDVRLPE